MRIEDIICQIKVTFMVYELPGLIKKFFDKEKRIWKHMLKKVTDVDTTKGSALHIKFDFNESYAFFSLIYNFNFYL